MTAVETEIGVDWGIQGVEKQKVGLWQRLAASLKRKLDSYEGVQVPIGDQVTSVLEWGNKPEGALCTKGKRGSYVLSDEGRKLAVDNLDRWKGELTEEGLEVNSGNLRNKYESAVSSIEYKDSASGLVLSSIRMRIMNMEREEKKAETESVWASKYDLLTDDDLSEPPPMKIKRVERKDVQEYDPRRRMERDKARLLAATAVAMGVFAGLATAAGSAEFQKFWVNWVSYVSGGR